MVGKIRVRLLLAMVLIALAVLCAPLVVGAADMIEGDVSSAISGKIDCDIPAKRKGVKGEDSASSAKSLSDEAAVSAPFASGVSDLDARIGIKGKFDYKASFELMSLINKDRKAYNSSLPLLKMDSAYLNAAITRAAEYSIMFDTWAYDEDYDEYYLLRPNGLPYVSAFPRGNARWGDEVGLVGKGTVQQAFNTFNQASFARELIRDKYARAIGVGVFHFNGTTFWVLLTSDATVSNVKQPANKTATVGVWVWEEFFKGSQRCNLKASPSTYTMKETKSAAVKLVIDSPWAVKGKKTNIPLTNNYLTFEASDTSIASVGSTTGKITGKKPGSTTIKVRSAHAPNVSANATASITQLKYAIKFYNHTGSKLLATRSIARNANLPVSVAPARTGYTFAGWYTAKSGGTNIAKARKAETLYARYTLNKYDVQYMNEGAVWKTVKVNHGKAPSATGPAKKGHTFVGWFTKDVGGTQVTKVTKKQTLHARFKINKYTTKYYDDSKTPKLLREVKANYDTNLLKSVAPAKANFRFDGWFTKAIGGSRVTKVTANRSVYAQYVRQYNVTYHLVDPLTSEITVLGPMKADINSEPLWDNAPEVVGFEFIGWYTHLEGGTKVDTITKNITVYARYVEVDTMSGMDAPVEMRLPAQDEILPEVEDALEVGMP